MKKSFTREDVITTLKAFHLDSVQGKYCDNCQKKLS